MFPQCTETMQKQYPNANIHFLGGNVINLLYKQKISPQKIIPQKIKSNIILFVGQKKYQKGANMLIDAFKILKQKNPSLTLHIIGMQNRDFEKLPSDVICHGYLHKDNETENTLYYNLMQNAKVIVNPSPQWAGFSSMVEAMFFIHQLLFLHMKILNKHLAITYNSDAIRQSLPPYTLLKKSNMSFSMTTMNNSVILLMKLSKILLGVNTLKELLIFYHSTIIRKYNGH